MKKMSGGQAAAEALRVENTKHVFGLTGSATLEMFDTLYDANEINIIGVRDERTGTHMADGYARASGQPGVILTGHNGPGATNLVAGLGQAKAAFSPVVSIVGSQSLDQMNRDAIQEADQQSLLRPVTKKSLTATGVDRLPEMFREAFRVAMTPRRGPVQLNLPCDILSATAEFEDMQIPESYRVHSAPAASNDQVIEATSLLASADRPVIIVGGGIKNTEGHEAVLTLADALNCPIVTSPGHGDAIPYGHPLNGGQMGPYGNPVAMRLVKEADVILALGTRLGSNSASYTYDSISRDAAIIHVELEPPAIGRFFPVVLGIWADASTAAQQLAKALERFSTRKVADDWANAFQRERMGYLADRDTDANVAAMPIQPSGLFKTLRDVLPKNAAITMDAGPLCLQATDAMNHWTPKSLFTPLDFGLTGFSFACGLGVKLAKPDRPVVSLMGENGFGMSICELPTAVDHGINTVSIVMNNKRKGVGKANPPFEKLAELYGGKGYRAETNAEVAEAIKAALECGAPAVVDVAVDPDAL